MFGKILKTSAQFAAGMAVAMIFDEDGNGNPLPRSNSSDEDQLDMLDDGTGNVIADGEYMSRQEAEEAQSRGELYDTFL
ncbi:hypothetical protein H8B19_16375 [Neptunicella marina]|uniref:Uncharacterized protein n=2 Tax=Neptunicella marina TaxID=2125989 RepID=A0A8J6IU71_9ALTE|nr:hypothetical protein [Neptunicella marina]